MYTHVRAHVKNMYIMLHQDEEVEAEEDSQPLENEAAGEDSQAGDVAEAGDDDMQVPVHVAPAEEGEKPTYPAPASDKPTDPVEVIAPVVKTDKPSPPAAEEMAPVADAEKLAPPAKHMALAVEADKPTPSAKHVALPAEAEKPTPPTAVSHPAAPSNLQQPKPEDPGVIELSDDEPLRDCPPPSHPPDKAMHTRIQLLKQQLELLKLAVISYIYIYCVRIVIYICIYIYTYIEAQRSQGSQSRMPPPSLAGRLGQPSCLRSGWTCRIQAARKQLYTFVCYWLHRLACTNLYACMPKLRHGGHMPNLRRGFGNFCRNSF